MCSRAFSQLLVTAGYHGHALACPHVTLISVPSLLLPMAFALSSQDTGRAGLAADLTPG